MSRIRIRHSVNFLMVLVQNFAKRCSDALSHSSWQGVGVIVTVLLFALGIYIGRDTADEPIPSEVSILQGSGREPSTDSESGLNGGPIANSKTEVLKTVELTPQVSSEAPENGGIELPKAIASVISGVPIVRHDSQIKLISASQKKSRIAVVGNDWDINVYSAVDGEKVGILRGHEDLVTSVSFSKDGDRLLSSSVDGTTRVWDIERMSQLHNIENLETEKAPSGSLARWPSPKSLFMPSESEVILYGPGFKVAVMNLSTGEIGKTIDLYPNAVDATREESRTASLGAKSWIENLAVSNDGRYIATIMYTHTSDMQVYDLQEEKFVNQVKYRQGGRSSLQIEGFQPREVEFFGPKGQFLVAGKIRKGTRSVKEFVEIYKGEIGRPGVGQIIASDDWYGNTRDIEFTSSYRRNLTALVTYKEIIVVDVSSSTVVKRIDDSCVLGRKKLEFVGAEDDHIVFDSCSYIIVRHEI